MCSLLTHARMFRRRHLRVCDQVQHKRVAVEWIASHRGNAHTLCKRHALPVRHACVHARVRSRRVVHRGSLGDTPLDNGGSGARAPCQCMDTLPTHRSSLSSCLCPHGYAPLKTLTSASCVCLCTRHIQDGARAGAKCEALASPRDILKPLPSLPIFEAGSLALGAPWTAPSMPSEAMATSTPWGIACSKNRAPGKPN